MNFIVGGEGRSGRLARAACPGPRVHAEPSAKAEPAVCIPGATQRPAAGGPRPQRLSARLAPARLNHATGEVRVGASGDVIYVSENFLNRRLSFLNHIPDEGLPAPGPGGVRGRTDAE